MPEPPAWTTNLGLQKASRFYEDEVLNSNSPGSAVVGLTRHHSVELESRVSQSVC